jgi:uncharacterized protein YcaQ
LTSSTLSPAEARRIALAAQGFAERRPTGTPDRRALRRVIARTGLLQIDSVNVLARAHYLPAFSRLGPYPTATLDRMAYGKPQELFEYWGHEASLLPLEHHPLLRWRMSQGLKWNRLKELQAARPGFIEAVLEQVRGRGPVSAGELETERPRRSGPWWDWHDAKTALEVLFLTGRVAVAGRRRFERLYDVPERVLPAAILAAPTPPKDEAQRRLMLIAARALGVATEKDLRDYYRLSPEDARARLSELVEGDRLLQVTVAGWKQPAYLSPDVRLPRWIRARALLAPFDPLVWERERTERLFGMRYRIEIYVPAPRRVYGYYVLPFLLGDSLVARVDLKADRQDGVLRVMAAHAEPGQAPGRIASELATELQVMTGWLGLEDVAVQARGDLAPALRGVLTSTVPLEAAT